jgi:pimeloyl-ACP methyl ester carboxylesterase
MASADTGRSRKRSLRILGLTLLAAAAIVAGWTWWAEAHPRDERQLRQLVHDRLNAWFPQQMSPDDGWHGLHQRAVPVSADGPVVVLIHGLDDPGTIWDDLAPALQDAGFEVWELHYPNDQGIDRSADFLAERWSALPDDRPAVLIGHSMGGLVARDFVSRWRHPVGASPRVLGPPVRGVILAGTPNHGSEWARLRIWMELRDQFSTAAQRRFSLFAALRDGAGEAKIDLRPGSQFLEQLNARPWPASVPILSIGGQLIAPTADLSAGLAAASAETGSGELQRLLDDWWTGIGDGLGDGVVTLDSLRLPGAPPPIIVHASHRGMLHRLLPGDPEPPAIAPILATLDGWRGTNVEDRRPTAPSG